MDNKFNCVHYLRQMRIANGGIVRFLLDYCQDLTARGHRVTVLTEDDVDVPPEWRTGAEGQPRVVTIPERASLLGKSPVTDEVVEAVRAADVLHVHCIWDVYLRRLVPLANRYGVPLVLSTHGMLNDYAMRVKNARKRIYLQLAGKWILRQAAAVHCTCELERQQAAKWLPRNNTRIVPLMLDRPAYETLPGPELARQRLPVLGSAEPKILTLGRQHPVKNIELLIRACHHLLTTGHQLQLILAGPNDHEQYVTGLHAEVEKLDMTSRVHFLGKMDGAEKVSLYEACDLFVLPSWQENFGMVLAESLAAETPVISTRCIDAWQEFEAAGARIVDSTPDAVARAIEEILQEPALLQELGRRGRQYVFDWLDPDRVLDGFVRLYTDAGATRHAPVEA